MIISSIKGELLHEKTSISTINGIALVHASVIILLNEWDILKLLP